ncbi:hypothetical protein ABPG75_013622 [Micractinium tetrahymenae]
MAWAARSAWGGGAGGSSADRARLPKGQEDCHICGADSPVEIKLQPCKHELCLGCVNSMRNANILRPDAGLKCPFCREFVDGFTDMNGRADTIQELVAANQAARKSMIARRSGAEKAVLMGVPDPQRLVPPVAPRREAAPAAETSWTCPHCRHVNQGNKAECARCRLDNPAHPRATAHKDPLTASEEEIIRAACERHHPGLNRAFLEAGTPWSNSGISGNPEAIRRALRSKGHERLMRVVHVLTSECGGANAGASRQLERVAADVNGNYAIQDVLESLHLLRQQAVELQKQGTPPLESFTSLPSTSPCKVMKGFSEMLRCLIPSLQHLATSDRGVHVLLKLVRLGSPPEVVYIAEQAAPHMMDWALTKDGALFVCNLAERLSIVASESTPTNAAKAVDTLGLICTQFCAHNRSLVQSARHQHLGPCVVQIMEGALPRIDAFKMGYQLALNAGFLCQARSGSRTLELLLQLKGGDLLCREMIRDLGCYTAKALQGQFGQLAAKNEQGGQRVVRALVDLMLTEREDEWLRQITEEVVAAGADLRADRDALDVLAHCLALPLWSPPESQRHWAALGSTPVDINALRQLVQAAKAGQQRLPRRLHRDVSEVQPTTPAEGLRRFPLYVRDGALQHPRHSMLKCPGSREEARPTSAEAAPAGPPPPPPRQQQAARAAPAGFAAGGAAAAAAPPAKPAAPPGFVGGVGAAAAAAAGSAAGPAAKPPGENGTVVFPDGARVPMPQPYSAPDDSSNSAASAAVHQAGSSSHAATVPPPPPPRPQAHAAAQLASSSSSNASSATAAAAAGPSRPAAPAPAPLPPQQPPMQQAAPLALSASAPTFAQPLQQAPRPALSAAAATFPQPQPGVNAAAPHFPQPQQLAPHPGMSAAAQPFMQQAPRPALSAAAPTFMQPHGGNAPPPHMLPPGLQPGGPAFQPTQPPPPHLAALPPHLQQRAQPVAAASSMPAPATPPQHAPGFVQGAATPHLPPPQVTALLPPTFRPAGAGPPAAPVAQRPPQPPRPAAPAAAAAAPTAQLSRVESTASSAGLSAAAAPAAAAPSADVFGGFSSLTEMLSELTATTAAQPAAPRPAAPAPYRPAYRPAAAYRPPGAAAPPPAAAAAPAARTTAASPAERFPMPAVPHPAAPAPRPTAPAPAAAAAAPLQAPEAGPWACKVCTYRHDGAESEFLSCAMCGSTRI